MENQANASNQNTQSVSQNNSNRPQQTSQKPKMNLWVISTFFFAIAFAITLGYFTTKSNNVEAPSTTTEKSKEETNETTSPNQLDENQYLLPTYIGPGGFFQLYFTQETLGHLM